MQSVPTIVYNNLDIRITIGNLIMNVLYIDYEAPRPSWYYPNHSHSSYELHLVRQGKGTLWVEGQAYDIGPGTLYLTGPDLIHEQKADALDPMDEYCINFELEWSEKRYAKKELYIKPEADQIMHILQHTRFWFGQDPYETHALYERILRELELSSVGRVSYVQSLVVQIILNAVRCFSEGTAAKYDFPTKTLMDSRRRLVDNYFRSFHLPLTNVELAEQIGTSVRQLDRIMQEYYSMSFKEKLASTRIEHVCRLLRETSLPLSQIAEQSGFSSEDYCRRAFKRTVGVTPGKYREG